MNLSVGIIGLPNAGKSTLFNALVSRPKASVAAHPFTTIDKNIGVVEVPDETLLELARMENIEKVTPATITFVDIAGLIKGAAQGEGLGNQFLHHIREVDLIFHLVRFFKAENVPHVHPGIDPKEDLEIVNDELLLADLATIDRRLNKEKVTEEEKVMLKKVSDNINKGIFASSVEATEKEADFIKALNLLTAKKQLLVANIGEDEIGQPPKEINGQAVLSISARLEAELAELPFTERQRFLKEYGLAKSAKEQMILASYHALDIITFYTIAKRAESRAWTIKKGSNALEAAAKIHTDFAKHFVKVEAINARELNSSGSWQKAHEAGKIGLHGKDYIVLDQDVLEFKVAIR